MLLPSNVKNERTNFPISFWKRNQNVLVWFPNLCCWEKIVSIWSRLCSPGPNRHDLFWWGRFRNENSDILASFLSDAGTFVLYCFDITTTANSRCWLGCNDFNNLDMQIPLWWLPNKILRNIHKKRFPFFWAVSCAFAIKVYTFANKSKKKFLLKNWIWVSKNAEFHADFESVLKKCTKKKLLAKMWRKQALFSLFTHVRQTFFAYNFLKLWSRTRKKRLKKSKNVFSKCVLDFNFAPIKGPVFFNF